MKGPVEERLRIIRRSWDELDSLTGKDPAAALELFGVLIGETLTMLRMIWRLQDRQDRLALVGFYLCGSLARELADDVGLTVSQFFRVKADALRHLEEQSQCGST